MIGFETDDRALRDAGHSVELRREEVLEATGKALHRIAQRVAAKAMSRAPRHLRGRLARLVRVHDIAVNLEEIAAFIESGGGDLRGRVKAIHGSQLDYTRGEYQWLMSAYLEEVSQWPDKLAKDIARHLPQHWR